MGDGEDFHDGKGLVVQPACGQAGEVNTLMHAREITREVKVHAVTSGSYLSSAPRERIERTVEDLLAFDPYLVVPMHCTGLETIDALRERAPYQVIFNSSGTRYLLER